jgi:hypothetical protein
MRPGLSISLVAINAFLQYIKPTITRMASDEVEDFDSVSSSGLARANQENYPEGYQDR